VCGVLSQRAAGTNGRMDDKLRCIMPRDGEKDSAGKTYYSAPPGTGNQDTSGAVNGVWLDPDEDADWVWTHGPNGSYVSGYNIRTKIPHQYRDVSSEGRA